MKKAKKELTPAQLEKKKKKIAKKAAKIQAKHDGKGWWNEFKKFISRGNVIDMAVGVIIGSAFSAIVSALVNILLSVCTWGVPGGLAGLVTVLPALNDAQKAPEGFKDVISAAEFMALDTKHQGIYVQHGGQYYYKGLAIIDWGTLINAAIAFFIVALTLFLIVKIVRYLDRKRQKLMNDAREDYYKKHPELRPVDIEEEKEPTDHEILKEMLAVMKRNNPEPEKSDK